MVRLISPLTGEVFEDPGAEEDFLRHLRDHGIHLEEHVQRRGNR